MTTMLPGLIVTAFATVALAWIGLDMYLAFEWDGFPPTRVPLVYRRRAVGSPRSRFDGVPHHAQLLLAQWTPVVQLPAGQTYGQPRELARAA